MLLNADPERDCEREYSKNNKGKTKDIFGNGVAQVTLVQSLLLT
jgi:hypothetical protein